MTKFQSYYKESRKKLLNIKEPESKWSTKTTCIDKRSTQFNAKMNYNSQT